MLMKLLLGFCLLHVAQSGFWSRIATNRCVGAKNNHYGHFVYTGPNTFVTAMKLVHRSGRIGCHPAFNSRWGCNNVHATNIIVTDSRNKRMYPSPTLVSLRTGGWYDLPGYSFNSPQLVFSDPGFGYLYRGQRIRIWYGEDLYGYTESDNHGFTCMDVWIYRATSI